MWLTQIWLLREKTKQTNKKQKQKNTLKKSKKKKKMHLG